MIQNLNVNRHPSDHAPASNQLSLVIGPTEVADVMTGKVVTLSPHNSFNEVADLMNDRFFRHCVVVDSHSKIVGVISDRDIMRALARNPNSRTKSLEQIMTRNPITAAPEHADPGSGDQDAV